MNVRTTLFLLFSPAALLVLAMPCRGQQAASIPLVNAGRSSYSIVVAGHAPKAEQDAARLLQGYLKKVCGAQVPVREEKDNGNKPAIFVGHTAHLEKAALKVPAGDGFLIASDDSNVYLAGGNGRGTAYSVCAFMQRFTGCRLLSTGKLSFSPLKDLSIPARLAIRQEPAFLYREVYYPCDSDQTYLDWHRLQRLDDLWGLWGHSSFKIIPPAKYFSSHPEYFALVGGKRTATQICPSNDEVFRLTVAYLKKAIAANPDALYWSLSPQDGGGFCSCPRCQKADREDGGPQGSWLQFVNRVARAFPQQRFVLLAYGPTAGPPLKTIPEPNVYIMLSSINDMRQEPMQSAPSAAAFRKELGGWLKVTPHVFVWDYTTQFTNFLAPFPDYDFLAPNLRYLKRMKVEGVFEEGSGYTYSDMAEYQSYLLSALLWDPDTSVTVLRRQFMKGYYGRAGTYVERYLDSLSAAVRSTGAILDIYGDPVHNHKDYLSPGRIDVYSRLLDTAESVAAGDKDIEERLERVRLPLEYTVLQQSLFFGTEKHGYLVPDDGNGGYKVNPRWPARVRRFVAACQKAGVTELSEGGLSPQAYGRQWDSVFARPWVKNLAFGARVTLRYPYSEDYPAKRERTLTDGVTGGKDYSLNWLFMYGNDLVATIDLGKSMSFDRVKMNFLQDERHHIYLPEDISVEVSADGVHYVQVAGERPDIQADGDPAIRNFQFSFKRQQARYVRVTAVCPQLTLPSKKKASLCCDEIYVL
jgi:hypothetical protein